MSRVDPDDDSVRRVVAWHYRYDPERHERRSVVVAAFDDETEFESWIRDAQAALERRQEAGEADPAEHLGGVVLQPGHYQHVDPAKAFRDQAVTTAWLTLGSVVAYLVWFVWDQPARPLSFDNPVQDFENWQFIGVSLTLGVIAVAATWRGYAEFAFVIIPVAFTIPRAIDSLPDTWLWPFELVTTYVLSLLVVFLAWTYTEIVRRALRPPQQHTPSRDAAW